MHSVLGFLVAFLFILEEFFHQRLGKAGRLSSIHANSNILKNNFDRYDLLRILELLLLGLLLSTSEGNPTTGGGQLTVVLTGLQFARLFGRRVLSRWSVLGVVQAFEMGLLLTVILMPSHSPGGYPPSPLPLLALLGGMVYGILVSIAAAFSLSYGIRLFARESSGLYHNFPPLADSEGWAYKFSMFSLLPGITGAASLFLLNGISLLSVFFSISFILQFAGTLAYRKSTYNGHHPVSNTLWLVSFLILYLLAVTGITTISPAV